MNSDDEGLPGIGHALAGVELALIDEQGQLITMPGDSGELLIGGAGVSRGYLNRQDLNQQAFSVKSFSDSSGRYYATGDLCRWAESGELEYIDRKDRQIKLHGYRIEAGEIEQQLVQLDNVNSALVQVITRSGQPSLVAWVTSNQTVDVVAAKQQLATFLPDYMVPDHLITLSEFPLTANGKVDIDALPVPENESAVLDFTQCDNQDERAFLTLANQCAPGIAQWQDDFFQAGGNSVAAVKFAANVHDQFGKVLPFDVILKHRTISAIWTALNNNEFTQAVIHPREKTIQRVPLSSSQRSVWFLAGIDPEDRAYHAKAQVKFTGDINPDAVAVAVQYASDRNEIFRTSFDTDESGEAWQIIHPAYEVELAQFDFSEQLPADADNALQQVVSEILNQPFDLAALPLVRWGLVRMPADVAGNAVWVLVHIEHHLVHDGWSYNLFLKDFLEAYNHACEQQSFVTLAPEQLSMMPGQYGDYCLTQEQWLTTSEAKTQIDYWQAQLADTPTQINLPKLPGYNSQDTIARRAGRTIRMPLPRKQWQRIEHLCRQRGETAFSFILAALSEVLHTFSGDRDICVGSAFANRNWVNADSIIGMMINTVVLRINRESDIDGDSLLSQCFDVVQGAQQHQQLPFETVVNAVNPPRQRGINPLFQVFMGFHDSPMPPITMSGISDTEVIEAIDSRSAKFDLSVVLIPRKGQVSTDESGDDPVHVLWEFKTGVFSSWFIEQLMASFKIVIERLLSDQQAQLKPVINQNAAIQGKQSVVPHHTVIEQVLAQAEATPLQTALRFQQHDDWTSISYQQLAERITDVASILTLNNVSQGDLVGLCLPRTPDMVIWMLAIQRVGAAYIPLDPGYPVERLNYIIEHSRVKSLVSLDQVAGSLSMNDDVDVICIDGTDSDSCQNANVSEVRLPGLNVPLNLPMYVIYTSGSTGKPKGVEISHHAFSNFIHSMAETFPLTTDHHWLAVTSCSFDISTLEIYLPLMSGATLVLANEQQTQDNRALADILTSQPVTHMQATPTTWRSLTDIQWQAGKPLTALCGGEALDETLAQTLVNDTGDITLFNMYGPTETTVWSAINRITPENATAISLGKPVNNTGIHILNDKMEKQPQGAIGQLWISGDSLATGYLHNPEMTGERFVISMDAGQQETGIRLYQTGDLAAINEAGELTFHGRVDHQIKLNGFRIETGEIEAVIRQMPGIKDVVVMVKTRGAQQVLVAWVATDAVTEATCRAHCQQYLPHYMVPSHVVCLDTLPLTPNGKIDRLSLPDVQFSQAITHVAQSETEKTVANFYCQTLGLDAIDIHTSFFDAGGQSLAGMRLAAQLGSHFDIHLSVADFIALSSVSRIASFVDSMREEEDSDDEFMEEFSL